MGGSHKGQKSCRTQNKVLSSLSSMSTGKIIQGKVAIMSHPSISSVAIDLCALPETSHEGNTYSTMAVCVDRHSGWTVAIPIESSGPFGRGVTGEQVAQANAATSMATIRHPINHHKQSRNSFHLIMVANIVFCTGHSHRICTGISSPSKWKGGKSWPRNNGTGKEVAGGMRHFMGRSITTNLGPTT